MNKCECVLQGILNDSARESFLEKLKGICHVLEVPFKHRERIYKSIPVTGITQTELRLLCNLLVPPNSKKRWTLQSLGAAVKSKIPVTIRTLIEVKTSDNIEVFLELIGYKLDFEYVREGTESIALINDKKYTITISKIKKRISQDGLVDIDDTVANTSFVEISTFSNDDEQTQTGEEMNSLAERFVPILDLAKVDYRTMPAPTKKPTPPTKPGGTPVGPSKMAF